jgi:hypothetical protein
LGRHDDSKRSGSSEIDRQLEPDRLLHRQLAGLRALEDLVHVDRATPRQVGNARSVGEEATEVHEVAVDEHRGQPMPQGKRGDALLCAEEQGARKHEDRLDAIPDHGGERRVKFLMAAYCDHLQLQAQRRRRGLGRLEHLAGRAFAERARIPQPGDARERGHYILEQL